MTQVIEPQVVDQLQMDQPEHQELANGADLGEANPPSNPAAKKKKKKRKNKKPSNATADDKSSAEGAKDSEHSAPSNKVLLTPGDLPSVPISKLYPNGDFPIGEIQEYTTQPWRSTSREKQDLDKLTQDVLGNLRRAAEVHRKVRQWTKAHVIRPGVPLIEIAQKLESEVWRLVEKDGLKAGSAFPTGLSLNHIAAHFSPNTGDKNIFGASDVLKVDFGVHVNGYIIDSAFTISYDPTFDPLINAVKEATNTGIKLAGIDARLGEIGAGIQEVMESYEVMINGKVYPVKSIKNLCGHDIHPYLIHAGKSVPSVKTNDNTKMEENEHYAIETFGSTGRGQIHEDYECSHYSKNGDARANVRSATAKQLLSHINQRYGTLTFCRRWLDDEGQTRHLLALKQLVDQGVVTPHPPFVDIKGSYTAQWEHTIFLRPTCKEVLSRGDDY